MYIDVTDNDRKKINDTNTKVSGKTGNALEVVSGDSEANNGLFVDISKKMDKVTGTRTNEVVTLTADGNAKASGKKVGGATIASSPNASTLATEAAVEAVRSKLDTDKMDKDTDATSGHVATFDTNGNAVDSSKKVGGATLSTKDANTLATEAAVEAVRSKLDTDKMPNLENRYILFIGDSYAGNWSVNSNTGWPEACIQFISSALGGVSDSFKNEHYKVAAKGGSGFSAGTTAVTLLSNFISSNSDFMNKVTDVVFAYGYNDAAKAVSSASSTYDDIKDKINLCNTLINDNSSHYVNKYLFAVGWGSNPDVRWQANHIYKSVYSCSTELGWIYSDLRYIMYDSDLYYKDWVHPNMNGSTKIAGRILNTLLGNSSIVNCEPKYYNTTTSEGDTVAVGYLSVVNNEFAQFFLTGNVIYDGSLVTVPQYGTQEICEITGLVPFGAISPTLLANCSFHIVDTVNNTGSNVMLSCYIIKKLEGLVEGHNKYKSYLYIKNTTDSEIKFNKLAPNNGVINIIPYL